VISFEPHQLVPGGVFQTIFGSLCPGNIAIPEMKQHRITVSSNCQILLCELSRENKSGPVVLLAHGMGGCSESGYMRRIATKVFRNNVVYMMNHRGSSCSAGKHDRLWNGGSSDDFGQVVKYISTQHPENDLLLVGFSLSGNVLLKYLGENDVIPSNVKGAFAVNPPIDLKVSSEILSRNSSCNIFNRYFMKRLHHQVEAINKNFPSSYLLNKRTKNIWAFDSAYTAPSAGFNSVEDYYSECSANKFLNQIEIPTTILSSRDDPFIPPHIFEEALMSSSINCILVNGGGHMGYISKNKTPWNDYRWMDHVIAQWIEGEMNPAVLN
jgi:predicted alpha/beta-fold hydrolase